MPIIIIIAIRAINEATNGDKLYQPFLNNGVVRSLIKAFCELSLQITPNRPVLATSVIVSGSKISESGK
jgi:hypothetical protein